MTESDLDLLDDPGDLADDPGRPDDATIRAELRDRGHDPPRKARLGKDWVALWLSGETATDPGDPGDPGAAETVTAASPPPAAEPGASKRPRPPTGERAPRRPKATGSLRDRLWGPKSGEQNKKAGRGGKAKDKPKHDRVPVDRVAAQIWEGVARVVEPIDAPVARCLHYQADLSGLMIERMAKGTLIDKGLQPLARGEIKVREVSALVGLPILVGMVERANELPEPQRTLRLAVLVPMLRECAAQLVMLSGDLLEERRRRDEEMGPVNEQVDELLQMILFGQPAPAPGPYPPPGPYVAEDQAAADAQASATPGGFMFTAPPGPPPPPGPYAHPYAEPRPRVIPGTVVKL